MTLDEAIALVENEYVCVTVPQKDTVAENRVAPDGRPYLTVVSGGIKPEGEPYPAIYSTPELAAEAWYLAVQQARLACTSSNARNHTLWWRARPEMDSRTRRTRMYSVWSRLMISKERMDIIEMEIEEIEKFVHNRRMNSSRVAAGFAVARQDPAASPPFARESTPPRTS
jgi:hypothetical protein